MILTLYATYQNPRSSGSQDIVFSSFSIAIMVESKKGHNIVNISRNSLKSLSGHLSIDRKPYAKYENSNSSGSQVIVLIRFLWPS